MADTAEPTAPEADDIDETPEDFDADRAKISLRKKNREAKALRDRLAEAEARLAKLDDAAKSDLEKAIARADAAEKRAAEMESSVMRAEIAVEKGLTPAQAKRLIGSTREELEEDADELLSAFGTSKPPAKPARELKGGREPLEESSADDLDPLKLADRIGVR